MRPDAMESSAPSSFDPLSVHLRHLPYSATLFAVSDAVATIVGVQPTDVRMLRADGGGRFSGRAFVSFRTPAEATRALEALNGAEIGGRVVEARRAYARRSATQRREAAGGRS